MRHLSLRGVVFLMVIVGPGLVGNADEASILPILKPPNTGHSAPNDAAVVIGIQDYDKLPKVPYAARDALLFHQFLVKTAGVPRRRISNLYSSPQKEEIERALEERAGEVGPGGTLWVYFAGHGLPDGNGDAVLLGVDARGRFENIVGRGVKRSWLVEVASRSRAARVVVVLDACFSGKTRSGDTLSRERPGLIPMSLLAVPRVAVWSATSAEDTAGPCEAVKHGLFTYFVVGALSGWGDLNGDRRVTLGEAAGYVSDGVAAATSAGGGGQKPALTADTSLTSWEAMRVTSPLRAPDLDALSMGAYCAPGGDGSAVVTVPAPVTPSGGPTIDSGIKTAAVADVAILAEPKKLVRLEVTPPNGKKVVSGAPYKNREGESGTWKVKASAAGYEAYETTFHAPVDDVTVHRIELKQLGSLEITGTPKGATVKVTGPGGFSHTGALTWKASGLTSGMYKVQVSQEGFRESTRTAGVRPGKEANLQFALLKTVLIGPAGIEWVYSQPADVYFGRSETTVAQYRACVEAGSCELKEYMRAAKNNDFKCNFGQEDRGDHPMNCIMPKEAEQFCEWARGRLPTWSEWESEASNGGRRSHPWGDEEPSCDRCIIDDGGTGCGGESTWPVCSRRTGDSISGLCDIAGNVAEWNATVTESLQYPPIQGGAWITSSRGSGLESTADTTGFDGHWLAVGLLSPAFGFRCVR